MNCHECIHKKRIPFYYVGIHNNQKDVKKFTIEYGNDASSVVDEDDSESLWMSCVEPKASNFRMSEERFTSVFPKNCGIGQFRVDAHKDYRNIIEDGNEHSLECLVCKPGFRAIRDDQHRIQRCVKIQFCNRDSETQWFNGCAKCEQGYAWKVSYDEGVTSTL